MRVQLSVLTFCLCAALGCGGRDVAQTARPDSGPYSTYDPPFIYFDAGFDSGPSAPSTLARTAAPPDPATATSFLENPAHTSYIDDPSLIPPLAPAWKADLGGAVSYPLIVGGTVYVLTTSFQKSKLVALDAQTGAMRWTVDAGAAFAHAYDAGQIFALDAEGRLAAFDAASGQAGWSVVMPGGSALTSPPTAYRGIVYANGGGSVYGTDESNGDRLWTQPVLNGDESAPTVGDSGVFVSYACVQAYAFDRLSGASQWHHAGACEGGGGATTVLSGDRLYTRDSTGNLVLNVSTGTQEGSLFDADLPPAFDGVRGFFVARGALRAELAATGDLLWSFAGDGAIASAPLVVSGEVYVGSSKGELFAVNAATGTLDGSVMVGVPFSFSDSGQSTSSTAGPSLAAASGILVVPAGTSVIAYTHVTALDAGASDASGTD